MIKLTQPDQHPTTVKFSAEQVAPLDRLIALPVSKPATVPEAVPHKVYG